MHDVFISFSFKNVEVAHQIVNGLQTRHGIQCWICTHEVYGGNYYKQKITRAIDEAQVVVLVQTKEAIQSREVPKEIAIAFEENKVIIPFKLDDTKAKDDLRYDLAGIDFIDGRKPTFDERVDELAEAILRNLARNKEEQTDNTEHVLASQHLFCNEIFVGRDTVLERLEEAFRERTVVFLHGMGGIGKSEIAKQYAKRNADKYETVVFARYLDSLAALLADDRVFSISGMSRKTKADNTLQDDEEYARDKLEMLRNITDQRTLIIIDNFDVTADPLLETVVRALPCHVLFTTRCKPETGRYFSLTVPEMDDEALREMMICYADPDETSIDLNDPDFPELFDMTDRHTLTLELIAKRMAEAGMDEVGEIVRLLKAGKLSSLTDGNGIDAYGRIRDLFRLSQLSEQECSFLRCLAMMPADGVLQKMFRQWIGDDFSARAHLMKLSLIRLDVQTKKLYLHPIVREVVVHELRPDYATCKAFVDRCAMVGQDVIPITWAMTELQKQAHYEVYKCVMQFVPQVNDHTYEVYENFSQIMLLVASVDEAATLQERLLAYAVKRFGDQSTEAMLDRSRLAKKYYDYALYDKAIDYYCIAADYFIAHPDFRFRLTHATIRSCSQVHAILYKRTGDVAYAKKAKEYNEADVRYGREMLQVIQSQYEQTDMQRIHMEYQFVCERMARARIHLYCEEYDQAEECIKEFYARILPFATYIRIEQDVAYYYEVLSILFMEKNKDYLKAKENLEKAMSIVAQYYPDASPRILRFLIPLTECCFHLGDVVNGQAYLKRAQIAAEALYTSEHERVQLLNKLQMQFEHDRIQGRFS